MGNEVGVDAACRGQLVAVPVCPAWPHLAFGPKGSWYLLSPAMWMTGQTPFLQAIVHWVVSALA